MEQIGYSLVDASGAEVQFWGDTMGACPGLPSFVRLPNGDDVHGISNVGPIQSWRLVSRIGRWGAVRDVQFADGQTVVTFPTTAAMVVQERERRLAAGFAFSFDDQRGEHVIGTTAEDMIGWGAVSTLAQAAINLGNPTAAISIVTNTGPVTITAMEWQKILVAAGAFQQPIWAASFRLQAERAIPSDYINDKYWA